MNNTDEGGGSLTALPIIETQSREVAAFAQFGSDLDAATQQLLKRGALLTELLKQNQYSPLKVEEQVCTVFSGTQGFLDKIDVSSVGDFEEKFLAVMNPSHTDILAEIKSSKEVSKDTDSKLRAILDPMVADFRAQQ